MTGSDMTAEVEPFDPERALIGAVFGGYRRVDGLATIVGPEDFGDPLHREIWREVLAEFEETGQPSDPVTLTARWASRYGWGNPPVGMRWPDQPGGPLYLVEMLHDCPLPYKAPWYAGEVAQAAANRRLVETGQQIADAADRGLNPALTADSARRALEGMKLAGGRQVPTYREAMERLINADAEEVTGANWPWVDVNEFVPDLRPGMLVVVGARPGVGKSLVGTNLATHTGLDKGIPTLLASLEMSEREVAARIAAARYDVELKHLLPPSGHVGDAFMPQLAKATAEIHGSALTIDDSPNVTVAHIAAMVAQTGARVTIVDYLQLVQPNDKRVGRTEQVGQISRDLKLMARQRRTCVIAMAQLNRASSQRPGGRPVMGDLRESGSIEQDSDVVMLLHRDPEEPWEMRVIFEKNRNGPRGERPLLVQGHYARLLNYRKDGH